MKRLLVGILVVLVILFFPTGKFVRFPHLDPYTHATEEEAKSFITIGTDEKAVEAKFGHPNEVRPGKDGTEVVWSYWVNPRIARESNSGYAGFEVFFKDHKVGYLGIILTSIRNTN